MLKIFFIFFEFFFVIKKFMQLWRWWSYSRLEMVGCPKLRGACGHSRYISCFFYLERIIIVLKMTVWNVCWWIRHWWYHSYATCPCLAIDNFSPGFYLQVTVPSIVHFSQSVCMIDSICKQLSYISYTVFLVKMTLVKANFASVASFNLILLE